MGKCVMNIEYRTRNVELRNRFFTSFRMMMVVAVPATAKQVYQGR